MSGTYRVAVGGMVLRYNCSSTVRQSSITQSCSSGGAFSDGEPVLIWKGAMRGNGDGRPYA